MENNKKFIFFGLLGLAGFMLWKSSKKSVETPNLKGEAPNPVGGFKDDEKKAPNPVGGFKDDGFKDDTEIQPEEGFKDKELGKLIASYKKITELSPTIDRRPSYDPSYFDNVEAYLATNPNAHLVRRGWMSDKIAIHKDVKELTKEEFEKADIILVDGKVYAKNYYIDYVLKPDPKVVREYRAKGIEEELKSKGWGKIYDEKGNEIGIDMAANKKFVVVKEAPLNDVLLNRMQPAEVIAKYDPDFVLEKQRIYGRDCCTTGYRGAKVFYTYSGSGGYSYPKIVDGVKYGVPNVGAKASLVISAKEDDGQAGVVLYRNDFEMTESGDWVEVR